jgi:hypothetical protein
MIETIVLSLIGLIGAFVIKAFLVWWFMKSWIQEDCKAQGPDYISAHYKPRLVYPVAVMMALLVGFVVMDIAWFSKRGMIVNVVRKLPLLGDWGDLGGLAWPLWAGAFIGLLLGTTAGAIAAIYGFPQKNPKCRRVLAFLSNDRQ